MRSYGVSESHSFGVSTALSGHSAGDLGDLQAVGNSPAGSLGPCHRVFPLT